MCLRITEDSRPIIASVDINCYKIIIKINKDNLDIDDFVTLFQKQPIVIGSTYHSSLIRKTGVLFDNIDIGLHSFCSFDDASKFNNYNKLYLHTGSHYEVVRCTIPKGSSYFKGLFYYNNRYYNSFASSSIVYDEVYY